ncbi:GNAT family N-acetyltransferase [Enterococcus alcedinis]|uniref:N-acetyltransferase domain-containing protein n=1 Tax=Enterococcus alcedinis TaxID=1274384 RepID=A0A917JCT1_9ENTE|nr:GNAT family N-acetyltransferase [Enterococcus alcedinis]MBP2101319.1 N-acetylglutamate synthase-like GNAT family acetyltransferase [Enterococcus alcedinis]GGI64381.1 hypothetical protein GCM10011482_00350 [Enterococcus alcedinis]
MFRKAVEEDVLALEQLLTEAWRVTYEMLYSSDYIERVIMEYYNPIRLMNEVTQTSREWSGYYVYEMEGKIVGCIGGGIDTEDNGSIYVLYLDPIEKGKGYGSALLENFTMLQKQTQKITTQTVSVAENNQMGLPFYDKMGFIKKAKQKTHNALENEDYQTLLLTREV